LSTVCYSGFSRFETTIVEKDFATAKQRFGTVFIVVTNADVEVDPGAAEIGPNKKAITNRSGKKPKTTKKAPPPPATAIGEAIQGFHECKVCAEKNYRSLFVADRKSRDRAVAVTAP
jgi:hypothetical protein